ncbi:MAG: hypothetical protein OEW04_14585, partial [Nitrospirota bacterium]|nr:hypothetical protein [Nitrospirota bacterium]
KKIILQWNYPAEKESAIEAFIILKSSGAEFNTLAHVEKNRRSYEDTCLEKGGKYRYKVVARNFRGVQSDDSTILDIHMVDTPPPPSRLSFSIKNGTLLLAWNPVTEGLFYNVYKSVEKGKYGLYPANGSPIAENSFNDTFTINRTVYYTVRSLHGGDIRVEGIPSEELAVDPSELIPSPLKNCGHNTFPDKVYLFWEEPEESWVTGFRIYRRTAGQDYQLLGETQIPVFVDNEPALTKRDYRVHAVGPAKEGPGVEIRNILYKPE